MREMSGHIACIMVIILVLASSGCVTPPKDTGISSKNATGGKSTGESSSYPNQVTPDITTLSYVTIETPYATRTPHPLLYPTLPPTPSVSNDYMLIYQFTDKPFGYNKTSISFYLKIPPMLIDFDTFATNVTHKKSVTYKTGEKAGTDEEVSIQYIDPLAWFEVTVYDKSTGTIVLQDGFGQARQYGTEHPRHMVVREPGNFQIEFYGNKLSASVNISVKKTGNINEPVV